MKNLKSFLGSFIILLVSSCTTVSYKDLVIPQVEDCIILSSGALCIENKKETFKKLDEIYGYSTMSNSSRIELDNFTLKLIEELICYRAGGKKC